MTIVQVIMFVFGIKAVESLIEDSTRKAIREELETELGKRTHEPSMVEATEEMTSAQKNS